MASSINTAVNTTTAYDATSVALGNVLIREAYAREILFLAQPLMHYFRFVTYREELGVQPGLTINIPTYRNIKRGKQLTEGVKMETQAMSAFNKQITVHEFGNALAFTELAMRASFRDLMADAVTQLSRDMALTVDCYLRDIAMAGATIDGVSTPVIYGRKDSSATKITSRASITADNYVSVATLKDALELLATANAPKFAASYYVCILHPHQSRKLRDDAAWIDVAKYASPENMLTGEIGKIDNIRFVETTLQPNGACGEDDDAYVAALVHGADGAPASIDVYQAIVMGEGYYAMAVSLPIELRDDGVTDHGRTHSLAWYCIQGAAVVNPDYAVIMEGC